jgi:hypothetical protein
MADKFIRRVDGAECVMPGCGRRFGSRTTPAFPVCPECQGVAQRYAEAQKKARKRAARQQAAQPRA